MIDRVFLVGPSTALDLEPLRGNEKKQTSEGPRTPRNPIPAPVLSRQAGWASRAPQTPKTPSGDLQTLAPPVPGSSLMRPLTAR
jgi:hypothetical protein